MISIDDKKKCCGCSACLSICPKKAISFKYDKEGFKYPFVDKKLCINCNLCEKVCPFANNIYCDDIKISNEELIDEKIKESKNNIKCYVCYNNDINVRKDSTSGGFFSVIANYVINMNGYVCGVSYDENKNICHKIIDKNGHISEFRGSKYVQSNQDGIFLKIKEILNYGSLVLYSGTPCQVEGLLNFLQKPYDNLITVDLVCHGVGSEKYWNKYKEYMEWKYNSKIKSISFREKTYGYNSSCMSISFYNGKKSRKGHNGDKYLLPFFSDYILRPSCYSCNVKKIDRKSDFTMGDFWDSSNLNNNFKKANGCTFLMCNSKKSIKIFNQLKKEITFESISIREGLLINSGKNYSMILKSTNRPDDRNNFFRDLNEVDYKNIPKLVKKYMPLTLKEKTACIVKPLLYKLKILELVKKIIK